MTKTQAAYAIDGQIVSSDTFYKVACDPARHVVVEACAGAGKTWMLVSRMLRALLDGAEPQQILGITFTKKAAAEMLERLNTWLADFAAMDEAALVKELEARGVAPEKAKEQAPLAQGLYLKLLQQGRSVQIKTFHGWFAALLRNAPLHVLHQLDLPVQFELQEDDSDIVTQTWRPFYAALLQDEALLADFNALSLQHGRSKTQDALTHALAMRAEFELADAKGVLENYIPPVGQVDKQFAKLAHPMDYLLTDAAHTRWHDWSSALGGEKSKTAKNAADGIVGAFLLDDAQQRYDALYTAIRTKSGTLRANLSEMQAAQQADTALTAIDNAVLQHQAWQHQQRMVRLTRLLITTYAQVKRSNGWVDMHDIEKVARVLLADPLTSGWVQERLDAQVRHVLIDEFQDTNPMQWHTVHQWLQSYSGAGYAPSVFIVGDPKQSIYRFRGAEPKVFTEARAFLQSLGAAVLSCDHTRRNSQAVIDAVNGVCQALAKQGDMPDFREHTTDSKQRGGVYTLPPIARIEKSQAAAEDAWRNSLQVPKVDASVRQVELECQQAAQWLHQCICAGVMQAGDVLVMSRKNSTLACMQYALAQVGLVAQNVEKTLLRDTQEVKDIVALLDALLTPKHSLSLAQALKSPLFGLQDDDLVQIAQGVQQSANANGERPSWLAWLQQQAQQPASRWQPVAETLTRWQTWARQSQPHDALAAIYHDGQVLERYAQATPPALRQLVLERLRALPSHALGLNGGRFISTYQWVRAMRLDDSTKAPMDAGSPDSIRLLTVHGAKGLEANVVLILDANPNANNASGSMQVLRDWPGDSHVPKGLVFLQDKKSVPPSASVLAATDAQAQQREQANGLYVGMTRARQMLVLSSIMPWRAASGVNWWEAWEQHSKAHMLALQEDGSIAEPAEGYPTMVREASVADNTPSGCGVHTMPAASAALLTHSQATTASVQGTPEQQLQQRMGEALHKVLEWGSSDATAQTVLRQHYALTEEQAAHIMHSAQAIWQGEAAWVWNPTDISWQANELDIAWQDRVQRLDRLVRHRQTGEWWVIDYKTSMQPLAQSYLRKQLRTYQQALQAMKQGEVVRAAFISADGRLHALED